MSELGALVILFLFLVACGLCFLAVLVPWFVYSIHVNMKIIVLILEHVHNVRAAPNGVVALDCPAQPGTAQKPKPPEPKDTTDGRLPGDRIVIP